MSLRLAKRFVKDASRKKTKGDTRTIEKQFADLRKAVRHIIVHLEKAEK